MTHRGIVTHSAPSADHAITLQCWVIGNDPSRVFPVEIAKTKTIGALKKAIKDEKKPEFDQLVADILVLWKVSTYLQL